MTLRSLDSFPLQAFDKLRYGDTDRQGHVNNAVFSTFLETGRVEMLHDSGLPLLSEEASFVIASLQLNYLAEITWPGKVDIGTGVLHIGNSSIKLFQQVFQHGKCVASAETVIVQVNNSTGRSMPLGETYRATLQQWLLG